LIGSVYYGGTWRDVTLKTTSDYWRGRTGHTVNLSFNVSGLTAATKALTGVKFKVRRSDSSGGQTGVLGETACSNIPVAKHDATSSGDSALPGTHYMKASSYGSGTGWHGPSITRTLSADAAGFVGATDFTLTYSQRLSIGGENGSSAQRGAFQCQITDASGNNIAGVRIRKTAAGNNGYLVLFVKGVPVAEVKIGLDYNNYHFGTNSSSSALQAAAAAARGDVNAAQTELASAQSQYNYWDSQYWAAQRRIDYYSPLLSKAISPTQIASYRANYNDAVADKAEAAEQRSIYAAKINSASSAVNSAANRLTAANKTANAVNGKNVVRTSLITKTGNSVTFNIGSYVRTFRNDAITDMAAAKVTFMFEQYGSYAPFAFNGISAAKFVKHNCQTWKDVPNKFSANDIVRADCKSGEIFLNGVKKPELGALGNDWEQFYLTPGLNQIGFSYSDWCAYEPTVKVRYREVFL
jgi:hypothetical protein